MSGEHNRAGEAEQSSVTVTSYAGVDQERDAAGRFAPGHHFGAAGGHARAARLSPERRREIARASRRAQLERQRSGDEEAADGQPSENLGQDYAI